MKKLSLDTDTLRVESFEAGATRSPRGTVNAHVCTGGDTCYCWTARYYCGTEPQTAFSCPVSEIGNTCESWPTEDQTCWNCD